MGDEPGARPVRIALIGDHNPEVTAHRAIPEALRLACAAAGVAGGWTWIHTGSLSPDPAGQLDDFNAIWAVPGSPYAHTAGALGAIRVARETGRPFLGTCGGFQHALLEYAAAVWDIESPAHAELDPAAADPVIAPLSCSLVDQTGRIVFEAGSRLAALYGTPETIEGYHCSYGLSPRYAERLADGPLRVSGRDDQGDVRAVELDGHPFYVATLFQPERAALSGRVPPIVSGLITAALAATPV